MNCDRCGGETKTKRLTIKKTGKPYVLFECLMGSMNPQKPQYPYSFFPPKDKPLKETVNNIMGSSREDILLLRDIKELLAKLLEFHTEKTELTSGDLKPDEETPF